MHRGSLRRFPLAALALIVAAGGLLVIPATATSDRSAAAPSTRITDAAFMAYPLPAHDPSLRGALVYADVFWRADAVGLRG